MDIALRWDRDAGRADIAIENGDLALDAGLTTAAIVSALCDARAEPGDVPEGDDKRGWWADHIVDAGKKVWGSRLWVYRRAKKTPETLEGVRRTLEEAFAWLVEDGYAAKITVEAEFFGAEGLAWAVMVKRPSGDTEKYRFEAFWKGL